MADPKEQLEKEYGRFQQKVREYRDTAFKILEKGEYKAALDLFETVLGINPGDEEAWLGKAEAYEKLSKKREAIETFKHALALAKRKGSSLVTDYAQEGLKRLGVL